MTFWSRVGDEMRKAFSDGDLGTTCIRLLSIVLASGLLVWLLDPALYWTFHPGLLWRNALPLALVIALIYGLCGRFLFSIVLGNAIGWFVFKVNAIKELNVDTPLLPGDLVLWHQTMKNIDFFAHYAGYRSILLVLLALSMTVAVAVAWRIEKHWRHPRWMARSALCMASLGMLFTLFQGDGFWGQVYGDVALPGFDKWDPILSVRQDGLMASLVRMSQSRRPSLPVPDSSLVVQFEQGHADELKARAMRKVSADLPDIVVVQSEAFFDPGILKGIDLGQYAPDFERLAATGITGSLTTPTYGGRTIRTEFETLTGYPMLAFPDVEYPYFGLAAHWMPTVPHRLESFGYSTALFHPFKADFWNRDEVMPELGFQRSHYLDDFARAARAGSYVSDRALFDVVLAHLDHRTSQPSYTMVITMENHGPWDRDDALAGTLQGRALPKGLSMQGRQEMDYYLSHLINGDAALGDFAQRLLARPRWTLLLFYGDHLPALSHAFEDLGFDDSGSPDKEHTRYMLLSNRPFSPDRPRRLDLHAYDLPGLLFDVAGLHEDGYLALAATILQDRTHDSPQRDSGYTRLQFNAAIMEVRCQHKLGLTGECMH